MAADAVERDIGLALRSGRMDSAAELGLRSYGPEILGFLLALGRAHADDAFSQFCEDLWHGLPSFRGESSFRTWAYMLARHAAARVSRDPYQRRRRSLSQLGPLSAIAEQVRSSTASFLATRVREGVARLRDALDPDDRALLVLRVDRQMAWLDIARVLEGEGATPKAITRRSAALRKRFERLRRQIREQAEREGLVTPRARRGDST